MGWGAVSLLGGKGWERGREGRWLKHAWQLAHAPSPPISMHLQVGRLLQLVGEDVDAGRVVRGSVNQLPELMRQLAMNWSDRVLSS